jgi:hypothetical protein
MNAAQLAAALGGKRSGRQWIARCPAHDDRTPSLIIFDGREQVQVRCQAGCEPLDVIAVLKARGFWGSDQIIGIPDNSAEDVERARAKRLALSIWREGQPAVNTMAQRYLYSRGVVSSAGSITPTVARFHPRCPRGHERQPALIVLMRHVVSHEPMAIQRIYLSGRGVKDGKPMMLGPTAHAAMMITTRNATFWDCLSYCPTLHVCEGFETGMALRRDGHSPVWALGSAGAIERLPVLFGVGNLVICADNDTAGLKAAEFCAERWNMAPYHRAVVRKREIAGEDFADGQAATA